MKILIVEDDRRIAEPIADDLRLRQHVVDVTFDGATGLTYALAGAYDLLLLDMMLSGVDGLTICRKVREAGNQAMIVVITARDAVEDKVATLDAGADDYLVKPFDLAELSARVRAVSRRNREARPAVLTRGALSLDPKSARVTFGGRLVALTRTEHVILETLMRNADQIFTSSMLLDKVTAVDVQSGPGSVKTHIANLRRKLRAAGCGDPIETVYGLGYRLAEI
jgi:two-component system response regulator QseB